MKVSRLHGTEPRAKEKCPDKRAGGLATNIKTLKANLALSALVALIGISAPIGLSFVLQGLLPITPLQAFAAGAALCSTSLGTTFTVLSTSGLTESRLGVVLTSAAMMDDVVGLIMVQVISNLGGDTNFSAITVVRPVLVSIAFAVVVPLLCLFVVKPVARWLHGMVTASKDMRVQAVLGSKQAAFVLHTGFLLAMVTGSTYAGTSNLFAAYLAGASITWLDGFTASFTPPSTTASTAAANQAPGISESRQAASGTTPTTQPDDAAHDSKTGVAIYESYYQPAIDFILKPFFFASVGFSIPITRMFSGQVVWRGFVYAALMTFAKLLCGACLVRVSLPWPATAVAKMAPGKGSKKTMSKEKKTGLTTTDPAEPAVQEPSRNNISLQQTGQGPTALQTASTPAIADLASSPSTSDQPTANSSRKRSTLEKPRSLYPAAILGSAMVARGEIGFLISSVAESNGVFGAGESGGSSELFLIVTWAILICTLLGPVTVGLMVRRVKRLQEQERERRTGRADPLGVWGVVPS